VGVNESLSEIERKLNTYLFSFYLIIVAFHESRGEHD
jgi:hypothetical protein